VRRAFEKGLAVLLGLPMAVFWLLAALLLLIFWLAATPIWLVRAGVRRLRPRPARKPNGPGEAAR
jgi:uncharacterized SAM-binding protein YcdF (DUF218 family)